MNKEAILEELHEFEFKSIDKLYVESRVYRRQTYARRKTITI